MLSRYSLKTILIVGGLVIALLPAVILGIGSLRAVRMLVMSSELERNELLAKGLAEDYEQFLTLHLQAITTIAAHVAAVPILKPEDLTPLLARTRPNYPAFVNMLVVDPSGKSIAADPPASADGKSAIGIDYSDRPWFKEVSQSKRPLVDKLPVFGRSAKTMVVSVDAPILDRSGHLRGVVAAGLSVERVQALASRLRLGKTGYAVAAVADGTPLAHGVSKVMEQQENLSKLTLWPSVTKADTGQVPSYVGVQGDERFAGFATVPSVGWKVWLSRELAEAEGEVVAAYRQVLGWVVVALLGSVGLTLAISFVLAHPIQGLRATAFSIAGGDLEQQAQEKGPKEVVAVARAFNQMAVSLRQLLTAEREGKARLEKAVAEYGTLALRAAQGDLTARVTTNGEGELAQLGTNLNRIIEGLEQLVNQIRQASGDLASASTEILTATTQQASGVAEEATAVQETSTTVDEVKQTAQVVTQKARGVAEAALKAAQISQDGQRAVEESTRGIQTTKAGMETIAERILALSEQAQAIGDITATVNDLAEQSNLLAVNAAIEAAKAGEVGKGFAVVATEMKSLAEQSKQATAQVREILGQIQKATQAAVMAAEQGVKAADAGERVSVRSGEAIRLLNLSVTESAQAAQQILASTQQQATGTDQIALAMQNIQQASAQNLASTRQVEKAAQDLNELGRRLMALIAGDGRQPRDAATR